MKTVSFFKAVIISLLLVLAGIVPVYSATLYNTSIVVLPKDSTEGARVLSGIIARVNEIQQMDKTNLTPVEKKALRKELNEMKKQADGLDSKVYVSVGAIIIIILLLILILR